MTGLRLVRAYCISLRQLSERRYAGDKNASTSCARSRCDAMLSGHSLPASMPSSYQTRKPRDCKVLMISSTAASFLCA